MMIWCCTTILYFWQYPLVRDQVHMNTVWRNEAEVDRRHNFCLHWLWGLNCIDLHTINWTHHDDIFSWSSFRHQCSRIASRGKGVLQISYIWYFYISPRRPLEMPSLRNSCFEIIYSAKAPTGDGPPTKFLKCYSASYQYCFNTKFRSSSAAAVEFR